MPAAASYIMFSSSLDYILFFCTSFDLMLFIMTLGAKSYIVYVCVADCFT
jgi:hypothetical protein